MIRLYRGFLYAVLAAFAVVAIAIPAFAGRTVYITKTGSKYHLGSCHYLSKSRIAIDIDDAVARGYTACSVCKPGYPDSKPSEPAPKEEQPKDSDGKRIPIELIRVIDGDTIKAELYGAEESIRYIGIDTPEMHFNSNDDPDPFAEEATDFNAKLLANRELSVELDVQHRDKYDRVLGYVWAKDDDGEFMVNSQIIRYGFAYLLTIPPDVKYVERFQKALEKAKEEKLNLWRDVE